MINVETMLDNDSVNLDLYLVPVEEYILKENTLSDDYDELLALDISSTYYYYLNLASDIVILTAYVLSRLLDNYSYHEYYYFGE
jgi:hypothetical protein